MGEKPRPREVVYESGIHVKPVYGPEDIVGLDYGRDLGGPGDFPFVRGIHPLMYRAQPWTMRQYSGFGTPRETNERFKFLIERGQTGLNVALDLPTQMALDSDDPRAQGEVGRVGMAVDSLVDMEEALEGIPLEKISVAITINAIAGVFIAMYAVVADRKGIARTQVRGTTQNDILKEFIGRGAWVFPVRPSVRLVGDTIEWCAEHLPKYNPVSVCGYHIRESGATPAQEMAYGFEIAKAYVREALSRGLDVDSFAQRLSFNFDVYGNLWENVAKFRAGRRVWAHVMRDEFGAKDPRSMVIRMIAGGGGAGLTREEPENNIVRGAYYALASALGGAQTMALCCYDEAYTIPSEQASKLSLRTMQILADEVGLTDTVDPLGGSYFVEAITNEMEQKIREHMREVEEAGGIVEAVERGAVQAAVGARAYEQHRALERGDSIKVGVNRYVESDAEDAEKRIRLYKEDPRVVREQRQKLARLRSERDSAQVESILRALRVAARDGVNLMPLFVDAVSAYATIGEIGSALRETFGELRDPSSL